MAGIAAGADFGLAHSANIIAVKVISNKPGARAASGGFIQGKSFFWIVRILH